MARSILKWVTPASLALTLGLFSLQASAQKDFVTINSISPVSDLRLGPFIPMGTTQTRGRDILPKGMASPFAASASINAAPAQGGLRFPADLQNNGGPILDYVAHHSIFVNPSASCPPNACFGDPIGFLHDLGHSQFIHLVDQYTNDDASGRYTVGTNFVVPGYTPSAGAGKPFTELDLAIAAYSLASQTGGFGFNHMYHLFLVPGQDTCFNNTFSNCYSPDNPNTWAFCAYHSAASDSAGNTVFFSVEPYQNVPGCNVRPGTPNGQLADSTNSVLSHEVFEAITDPLGTAWWNSVDNGIFGEEIGDECSFLLFTSTAVYFDPSPVRLNRKQYAVQPEYSNSQHACSTNTDTD